MPETSTRPPSTHQNTASTQPWYRRTWSVVTSLIVFLPLGLFLMWTTRPRWPRRAVWAVTLAGAVIWLGTAAGIAARSAGSTSTAHSAAVAARVSDGSAPPIATLAPTPTATSAPTPTATAAPTVAPTSRPTSPPAPVHSSPPAPPRTPLPSPATPQTPPGATPRGNDTCGAPANPWGYNFCYGEWINNPNRAFCSVFPCVANFWKTAYGAVEQCNDGKYTDTPSPGQCDGYGGGGRPLYQSSS